MMKACVTQAAGGVGERRWCFSRGCTPAIAKRLEGMLGPVLWLGIGGYWYSRGGMPIDVPERGVAPYRGRG
jgi:hypothetical protein